MLPMDAFAASNTCTVCLEHSADGYASLQDHYPAVDRDKVNVVMNKMVQAGRLWRVPHHTTLVRMGGMIMPEAEAEQAMSDGDADMFARVDEGKLISDKVCTDGSAIRHQLHVLNHIVAQAFQHCRL